MATFMRSTEWLRALEVSPGVSVARESLGVMFGASDWFVQDALLEELLAFLNDPAQSVLMAQLDRADSEDEREGWSSAVMMAYRYTEPVMDENYGMSYRYDKLQGVYEWENPQDPGTWLSQEEADRLMVAWAEAYSNEAADAALESVAAWDENWGMFYRLGADGSYQYAHARQPGVAESGPGDDWLTYEQAVAGAYPPASVASVSPPGPALPESVGFPDQPTEPSATADRSAGSAGGQPVEPDVGDLPAPLQDIVASLRALDDNYRDIPVSAIVDALGDIAGLRGTA
jgi:hypothetical protein